MAHASRTPVIIEGGLAIDDRGHISFVNGFAFEGVKRMYQVGNFSLNTVRAFHGHMKEAKYVYVAAGSAVIAAVEMDDTKNPGTDKKVERYILSARKPSVLYIPPGYANGFKPLEGGTVVLFFSTASVEDSKKDDYRFPYDYWGSGVWDTENR
ncbi:MAG: dTDP-4-dehydrorhamnose 3,5-epimerase family protein [bacterium]|nr:dTDP-4-dehydrorhamnose 3,5-epimerase family protein [bacterium]